MPAKYLITSAWAVEGTAEEIAELAATIDQQTRDVLGMEGAYHGVPEGEMSKLYMGTFISTGVNGGGKIDN